MDIEVIVVALVAAVPISIYLVGKYFAMKEAASPGGENITWNEIVDTFSDSEFWDHVDTIRGEHEKE